MRGGEDVEVVFGHEGVHLVLTQDVLQGLAGVIPSAKQLLVTMGYSDPFAGHAGDDEGGTIEKRRL